jgi:hypothetical protein
MQERRDKLKLMVQAWFLFQLSHSAKAEAALQHFEKASAIEASTATLMAAEVLVDSRLQEVVAAYEAMKQNIKFLFQPFIAFFPFVWHC